MHPEKVPHCSPFTSQQPRLLSPPLITMEEGTSSSRPVKNPRSACLSTRDSISQDIDPQLPEDDEEDENDDDDDDGYDGTPEVGMVFKNHHEVSRFYKRYARRVGFGVAVRRSSFSKEGHCLYLELMCCKGGRKRPEPKFRKRTSATTGCKARIRVKLWGDEMLHLELASLDHNHPVCPSMAKYLTCYKNSRGYSKKHPSKDSEQNSTEVQMEMSNQSAYIDRLYTLEKLLRKKRDLHNFAECHGRLRFNEGDSEELKLFFAKMQAKNSNFFNMVILDDEGYARSAFWADARSRASFQYFNDVVTLDTSYIVNKYDLQLACFVGVNHHGQNVLLGCALLSDQTVDSYMWLFKAWIACMTGYTPNAVISDFCKGIQCAVAELLPGVRHRFCLFQLMKKAPEKLGGLVEFRLIHKQLQKTVYDSLTVEEFEKEWSNMIEIYGLQGNEWLNSLYMYKESWVPVYLKDTFWAGMSTTQKNETLPTFFEGYVDAKTTLKQFLEKYETALESKYEKEAQADFETFHKRRPAVSKFYMEEQLSNVYTINMFKKFQDEIEGIMYCHASVIAMEGASSSFNVKECIFLEDGKRTMNKNHGVLYNSEKKEVRCICGSFEFRGILCRHVLSVFKFLQILEIPSHYILDRWKKDYKKLHFINRSAEDYLANNRVDRYDYLSMRCLQLVEVGVLSDKYQLALKLLKEAEKFLLSDNTYDDTRPNIISHVNKANKPELDGVQGVEKLVGTENGNDERRRRARLSQTKESLIPEGTTTVAKISQGTSAVPNPCYPFHVIPAPSYLQPQIAMQPSTKHKAGAIPNTLPVAGQFAVPISAQPYMSNHAALRPIVYMFPGPSGFDPQTAGNGQIMPWIYPSIPQNIHGGGGQHGKKKKAPKQFGQHVQLSETAKKTSKPTSPNLTATQPVHASTSIAPTPVQSDGL